MDDSVRTVLTICYPRNTPTHKNLQNDSCLQKLALRTNVKED